MKRVALGLLGTVMDRGQSPERWDKWRPSVSLFQHEDLKIDRFELLTEAAFRGTAGQVQGHGGGDAAKQRGGQREARQRERERCGGRERGGEECIAVEETQPSCRQGTEKADTQQR